MDNTTSIPTSLKVVAFLFVLSGVFSLIEIIVSLMYGRLDTDFKIFGLFISLGLLRLSRGWWKCALVFLWIEMIGLPISMIIFMNAFGPIEYKLFGQGMGHVSKGFTITFIALGFALAVWQYRVLTRPNVRRLFLVRRSA